MQRRRQRNMASKNDQSVIDLTKMNKFSFAKLKKLKATLDDSHNSDDYRIKGDLLYASLHLMQKGMISFLFV